MTNLRELAEADLAITLEDSVNGFGLPGILIDPQTGVKAHTADEIFGQIIYDTSGVDSETGAPIIVHRAVFVVRRSSLLRVPQPGELWVVHMPTIPSRTAPKETFVCDNPREDGGSIGFIRLYCTRTKQATP